MIWQNAVAIGSIIFGAIMVGFNLKSQSSRIITFPQNSSPSSASSPSIKLSYKNTCGSPPGSGSVWYAVVGDSSALNIVKNQYCGDSYIRRDKNVQVASFTSFQEAEQFAQALQQATGYRFWVRDSLR